MVAGCLLLEHSGCLLADDMESRRNVAALAAVAADRADDLYQAVDCKLTGLFRTGLLASAKTTTCVHVFVLDPWLFRYEKMIC